MPNNDEPRCEFAGQVRVLQIIVAAITLGPLVYLGVVLAMVPPRNLAAAGDTFLTYAACGMAAAAVAGWLLAPPIVTTRLRRQIAAGIWPPPDPSGNSLAAPSSDAGKLCALYNIRTIIAVAILESAAFFLVFTYQQQRDVRAFVFALLLTLMIALHLPTRVRVAEWVERQSVRLADDRQAAELRR